MKAVIRSIAMGVALVCAGASTLAQRGAADAGEQPVQKNAATVYLQAEDALDLHLGNLDALWRADPWTVDWSAPAQAESVRRLDESEEMIQRVINASLWDQCDFARVIIEGGQNERTWSYLNALRRVLVIDAARHSRAGNVGTAVQRVVTLYLIGEKLGEEPPLDKERGWSPGAMVAASWVASANSALHEMLARETPLTLEQIDALLGAIDLADDADLMGMRRAAWNDAMEMADQYSARWYVDEWLDEGAFRDRVRRARKDATDGVEMPEEDRRIAEWLSQEAIGERLHQYAVETAFVFKHWDAEPAALEAMLLERGWRPANHGHTCGDVACPWAGSFPVPGDLLARYRELMGNAWTREGEEELVSVRFEPLAMGVWCTLQMHCQQCELRGDLEYFKRRLEEKRRALVGQI